ncbi:MAG: alanine racemase, partial [Christensenellales bacterium]
MKCFNNFIVNTDNLKNNARNIKEYIGDNCKFCAVVKANAYGIGLETACKALFGIADFFACACLKEALSIRVFDKETPILILGRISKEDYKIISDNNISISVGELDSLENLSKLINSRINIHLQVNTGLNRFGFRNLNEFKKALKIISDNKLINLEGVYSHFATKKNDITFINKQFLRFLQFKKKVTKKDVIFHIANSYATIHSNKYHLNMVRNGFLLYGNINNKVGNLPILSITSQIISTIQVKKGDTI